LRGTSENGFTLMPSDAEIPEQRRRVTMREVARAAAVSLGTVSRVINRKATVRAEVRERVTAAMDQLGYVPDAVAQSMRTQATRALGCIVSDISNPLFSRLVAAAEGALKAADYTMVLTASHDSTDREMELLSVFRRRRLDGIMTTVSREGDERVHRLLQELPMPVILVERSLPIPVDTVVTDHFGGAYQATSYLLTLGHRRIGLITVTQEALPGRERMRGFRQAHAEHGVSLHPELTAFHGLSAEYGYSTAYELLSATDPPTAIIAGAGQMLGVLKATRALGVDVPRDLSLIRIGDTDLAELFSPPLTVVRWEPERVGRVAAELLISRISGTGRKGPLHVVLPAELVLRRSCAPARG
jgi:LacI family transcriptional regulator